MNTSAAVSIDKNLVMVGANIDVAVREETAALRDDFRHLESVLAGIMALGKQEGTEPVHKFISASA